MELHHDQIFNPYHAEFHKWKNPPSIFGTIHFHFWGYQDENLKLVSQHGCAGWPGSIHVAKSNHFWYWQDKG